MAACVAAAALSLTWGAAQAVPPAAPPFTVWVPVGEQTPIEVFRHVSDVDGDLDWSTFAITTPPQSGTTGLEPGVIHYSALSLTPETPDSLTYRICDLAGDCVLGDVEIWVGALAQDDNFVVTDGTTTVLDVLANDFVATEFPGDPSTLGLLSPAQSFEVINGAIVYTSAPGFNGVDGVTYSVCTTDGTCEQASVSIDIVGPTPPVAVDDLVDVTFGNTVTILPLLNDTDAGGDLIPQVTITELPGVGTVDQVAPDTIEYTPAFSGSTFHRIGYQICDQAGSCDSASIIIRVLPLPPGTRDDLATAQAGSTIEIDVLANDTYDPAWLDPNSLSVIPTDQSQSSLPTVRSELGTPRIIYEAPAAFGGTDTFWYSVCHTNGGCNMSLVSVMVQHPSGFSSPTVAFFETDQPLAAEPDGRYRIEVLSNVTPSVHPLDPDSVLAVTQPPSGSFSSEGGFLIYQPGSVAVSDLDFRYQVCDSAGLCGVGHAQIPLALPPTPTPTPSPTPQPPPPVPPAPEPTPAPDDCTVVGTDGDDLLRGTAGDDVICGLGGNDRLLGLGGNDILRGGPGDDDMRGGSGDDVLRGNGGNDILRGGSGRDRLLGGAGNDRLKGGRSRDVLRGGRGADTLKGGSGADKLYGNNGRDRLFGGSGSDQLRGGRGRDLLNGGTGTNLMIGGPGRDVIIR